MNPAGTLLMTSMPVDTTKGQAKPSIANSFQLPLWVESGRLATAVIGQERTHRPKRFKQT